MELALMEGIDSLFPAHPRATGWIDAGYQCRRTHGSLILALPASSLNDGNGGEKLDREFMQQTSRLLKRKAAINH